MRRSWDNWAIGYRNARALGAVVLALVLLGLLLFADSDEGGTTERASGTLIELGESGGLLTGLVALADGKRARILLQRPKPQPGDEVPLLVETATDGTRRVRLDVERWRGY